MTSQRTQRLHKNDPHARARAATPFLLRAIIDVDAIHHYFPSISPLVAMHSRVSATLVPIRGYNKGHHVPGNASGQGACGYGAGGLFPVRLGVEFGGHPYEDQGPPAAGLRQKRCFTGEN